MARSLAADWRRLMPRVRASAARLKDENLLLATQKGRHIDPTTARGPIRLSLPRK